MKIFWTLIAVLVLATAGVMISRRTQSGAPAAPPTASATSPGARPPAATPPPPPGAPVEDAQALRDRLAGETSTAATPQPTGELADASPAPQAIDEAAMRVGAPPAAATAEPRESSPAPQPIETASATGTINTIEDLNKLLNLPPLDGAVAAPAREPAAASLAAPAPVAPSQAAETASTAALEPPAELATALDADTIAKFKEIVPARVRKTDDGWTILDERFPVRGEGTADKPYEITWDLLVSASETFQPRMGKMRMPERIAMLHNKHIRVTGYVAFPIMATSADEMLSMRNMWDGCCIGVPPTPYDAVEVKLAAAATGKERFTSFGSVEGLLKVDPYIKGNWLLGLYLLENGKLTTIKEGVDPNKHGKQPVPGM